MKILELRNLKKKYKKAPNSILNGIDLAMDVGEIIGLYGINGSGKSTLFKSLFGVTTCYYESIKIFGKNHIPSKNHKLMNIAYLPQGHFLPGRIKVHDIIEVFIEDPEKRNKIYYSELIPKYSMYQVRDLAVGILKYLEFLLILHSPHPVLLFDEPFTMVDPKIKELMSFYLKKYQKRKGIIIADHYYEDVWEIADSNFVMRNGLLFKAEKKGDLVQLGYLKGMNSSS